MEMTAEEQADLEVRRRVSDQLHRWRKEATEEGERTHKLAQSLAERSAAYYRELVRWELPSDLIATLVTAYHVELLARTAPEKTQYGSRENVFYVPVPLRSSSEG